MGLIRLSGFLRTRLVKRETPPLIELSVDASFTVCGKRPVPVVVTPQIGMLVAAASRVVELGRYLNETDYARGVTSY